MATKANSKFEDTYTCHWRHRQQNLAAAAAVVVVVGGGGGV